MSLVTRPLTGLPAWPITLLAGVEKSGKTLAAVAASASQLVHRTFLLPVGEDVPDEYGRLDGQRTEVVEHTGTYGDVKRALLDAVAEPWGADGQPNLIVMDSGTRVYDLIMDTCMDVAVARAQRNRKPVPDKLPPDLWNVAHDRWYDLLDILRTYQGPSIITARLDLVTAFENGQPTSGKTWKVQGHKGLAYDVGAIVELREQARPGSPAPAILRGVRSLALPVDQVDAEGHMRFPAGLSMDTLWRGLGLTETVGHRTHAAVRREAQGAPAPAAPVVGAPAPTSRDAAPVSLVTAPPAAQPPALADTARLLDIIRNAPSVDTMGVQLADLGLARRAGQGWDWHPDLARIELECDLGQGSARSLIQYMTGVLPEHDPTPAADFPPLSPRPADRGLGEYAGSPAGEDDLPHGLQSHADTADWSA